MNEKKIVKSIFIIQQSLVYQYRKCNIWNLLDGFSISSYFDSYNSISTKRVHHSYRLVKDNPLLQVFQEELCRIYIRCKIYHNLTRVSVKLGHFIPLLENSHFSIKITLSKKNWRHFCFVKDIKVPEKSEKVLVSFVFRIYHCKLYNNMEFISYQLLVNMGS